MTMPIAGHPDWNPTTSVPVTVLAGNELNMTPGSWGPVNVPVTSGGAYLIAVGTPSVNELAVTDLLINQLDPAGNTVAVSFFGGIYTGYSTTAGFGAQFPTAVRGNIYGSTLQLSGTVAASVWQNTVFGTSGLTAGNINVHVYVVPNALADPEPVIYAGGPQLGSMTISRPGNVLYSTISQAIAHGASGPVVTLVPYAGPAVFSLFQAGVTTTPTNLGATLLGYSVVGGTTPIVHTPFATPQAGASATYAINLPSLLSTIQLQNFDSTQNATAWASIVGSISD